MDIAARKLNIIEQLARSTNLLIISKIEFILKKEKVDAWDTLSTQEQASIDRGLKDLEEGKKTPHSKVRKKYEKWL